MTELLREVQDEHQQQVAHTIASGHSLWVPGRDQMTPLQRGQIDHTWNTLTGAGPAGAGNRLRVDNTSVAGPGGAPAVVVPGFSDRVHAMHARLMTTPGGRDLIDRAQNAPHTIDVRPNHPLAPGAQPSVNVPPGTEATGLVNPLDRMGAVTPHALGGADSEIAVPSHMSDIEYAFQDAGYTAAGAEGRDILAPAFLTYGHELGHATNNQRGELRTQIDAAHYAVAANQGWDNAEEEHTIRHVENPLRAEHGLTPRQWHRGGPGKDTAWQKTGPMGQPWTRAARMAPAPARYWWT
jgi:hypothetical protein